MFLDISSTALLKTFEILENKDHLFSAYVKFSEMLTFLTLYTYQGVRNVCYSKKIMHVLNE